MLAGCSVFSNSTIYCFFLVGGRARMTATDVPSDSWQQRLRGPGEEQGMAIKELRAILVRGLRISLANRYGGRLQPEDIVQVALMKILGALDSFEGKSRFTTWAMSIATRVGICELRRKHYQEVSLDSITSDASKFDLKYDERESAEQGFQKRRLLDKLQQLIASELTQNQRVAIHGLLEGLPIEVIAERTRSNRNAVYKLVHDARLRLRAGLENAGLSEFEVLSSID